MGSLKMALRHVEEGLQTLLSTADENGFARCLQCGDELEMLEI
jgi:hypothetical protein